MLIPTLISGVTAEALAAIGQFATYSMGVTSDGYWLKFFNIDGGLVAELCGNTGLDIAGADASYPLPMTLSSTIGAITVATSQSGGRIVSAYLSDTTHITISSILHNGTWSAAKASYLVVRVNSAP